MIGLSGYIKRKKLEIDVETQKYRDSFKKEIEVLALRCAKDKGAYEHEFHSTKERLGIEIAKLEAIKETLTNDVSAHKEILKEKDKEIERMNKLCLELTKRSDVFVQK